MAHPRARSSVSGDVAAHAPADMTPAEQARLRVLVEEDRGIVYDGTDHVWRDNLGFALADDDPDHPELASPRAADEEHVARRWRRARQWSELIDASGVEHLSHTPYLKALCRAGVPAPLRTTVWLACCGVTRKMHGHVGYYAALLEQYAGMESAATRQVAMDVTRTFPSNAWLSSKEERLQRVLTAYSWRNPGIGYCQSLNFIAGALLILTRDEESAFWMLCHIIEHVLPGDYYTDTMLDAHVDQRILKDRFVRAFPQLAIHFAFLGVDVQMITLSWFTCLFLNALPLPTVLRVWDALFCEDARVLFRVALALFAVHEQTLLAAHSYEQLFELLRTLPARTHNADRLLRLAHDKRRVPRASTRELDTLREQYRAEKRAELGALEARREAARACERSHAHFRSALWEATGARAAVDPVWAREHAARQRERRDEEAAMLFGVRRVGGGPLTCPDGHAVVAVYEEAKEERSVRNTRVLAPHRIVAHYWT